MVGSRNGISDFTHTLATMKLCRDEMIRIARCYPPRHPIAREAGWLVRDIDALAGIITGKPDWWHEKGSTAPRALTRA